MNKKNPDKKNSSFICVVRDKVKGFPSFYAFCRFIFNPGFRFYPHKRNRVLKSLLKSKEARILNIGSGNVNVCGCVINADICAFEGVDVVCDAHALPFKPNKFDGLLMETILEHVIDPVCVVKEASRVLKAGGILFAEVPFMYEFHQAPEDYYRFTLPGTERLLKDFNKIDSGIDIGPTGTLNAVLRNYFALFFSFNIRALYEFFNIALGIFLFPLKLLDFFLIRLKCASNISSVFYFIGKKARD